MQSILRILKINEPRKGVKEGREWSMQDAECLLLNDDGTVAQVGVLQIPKLLQGTLTEGDFLGTFALRPNMASRKIEAQLVGLTPYGVKGTPPAAPDTSTKAPSAPVKG